jgi:hypothetical protein
MQVDLWVLWFLGELLIATTAVAAWLSLNKRRVSRQERQAAQALVDRIKEEQPQRREETRKILVHRFGLPEAGVEQIVTHIDREEKRFLQTMLNAFLERDPAALEGLNIAFEAAVGTYRELQLQAKAQGQVEGDPNEIRRLKEEKNHLAEELRITMETMGRMLNEYASMYTGGAGDPEEIKKVRDLLKKQGHPVPEEFEVPPPEETEPVEEEAAAVEPPDDEEPEFDPVMPEKKQSVVEEITLKDSVGMEDEEGSQEEEPPQRSD